MVVKYTRPILVKHRWIAKDVSADCLYHLLSIFAVCVDERVRLLFMAVVCRVCILFVIASLFTSLDCTTYIA